MPAKSAEPKIINRVSDASVFKATGKEWDEWIKIMEKAGARTWRHGEMTEFLARKHKLSLWWRQIVASGYQVAVGLRAEGRNSKGQYSITATKMVPFGAKKAWAILASPEGLEIWLRPLGPFKLKPKAAFETDGGVFGEVRTMVAGTRARLSWRDSDEGKASTVQVQVYPRPKGRAMYVIQHDGLVDGRLREDLRARWKGALEGLLALGRETPSQTAK